MSDEIFTIIIDFDKDAPKPSRVFQSMADIIQSFESLDSALVKSFDNKLNTVLVIEDIEKGSLKTVLRNVLKGIPDDALKESSIKKLVGHYLLKVKYIILNKLEDKVTITDGSNIVEDIEYELVEEAKKSGVDKLPYYNPVSKTTITEAIKSITNSISILDKKDSVVYDSIEGHATFNIDIKINPDDLENLITDEKIVSNSKMILKVKKPDYLGDSQWSFKHGEHSISAKITHLDWLRNFQNGNIDLRPQDSLSCMVETTVKYDENFEVISTVHIITEVINVHNKGKGDEQSKIKFE